MRIAIVNDLDFATHAIAHAIEGHDGHTVSWTASSGREAIQKCALDTPDLLLMDMVMDPMDGVETTRVIMKEHPCPILIVTATVEGNSGMVFRALGYGALDVVTTPALGNSEGRQMLLKKINQLKSLLTVNPRRNLNESLTSRESKPLTDAVVVIGASAGGPAALSALLSKLPASFPAGVVIVQHIDARFSLQLAEWLSKDSKFPVQLAVEGSSIKPGQALLADGKGHLVFKTSKQLGYISDKNINHYTPSVDALFHSAATLCSGRLCGVLLTGMGKDGANGLQVIKKAGFLTIAQDRASSALYGMPKAAVEMRAASEILPLENISERLCKWLELS